MSYKNLLEGIYLFKGLSGDLLDQVNQICKVETFEKNVDLFKEGDVAEALYIIKTGSVKIHLENTDGDHVEVANLGIGSHFGEMAFLDHELRSATATTREKTEILSIDYKKFKELLVHYPSIAVHVYRELSRFLCGRLRITTNDLSFAREQNLSHF